MEEFTHTFTLPTGVYEQTHTLQLRVVNSCAGLDDIITKTVTIRRDHRTYFVKDHLGSVRATVNEAGDVISYDDYYPFGLTMPGRSSNSANPNDNYKFTGHERDDEAGLTIDYMGARTYDPVIARMMQIDPMSSVLPSWSPYVYSFNNPISFFDPDGLYPIKFFIRSFAPFKTFGGGFHGDNRGYTTSTSSSTTSRIQQNFTFETDDGSISGVSTRADETSHPLFGRDTGNPDGSVSSSSNSDGYGIEASYAGNNPLVPSPDINVFSSLSVTEGDGAVTISGSLTGDNFPSTEAFVQDASGNSVFLGIGLYQGGPFSSLFGENKDRDITSFSVTLSVDKDGNFTGVTVGDKSYSISEWNKFFEEKDPHNE